MSKKKGEKLNDYKPEELEAIKSDNKKLNERVDALAELLGDLEGKVKEIEKKSYPGDIANAIREGFANLKTSAPTLAYQAPPSPVAPVSAPPVGGFRFDIFSVGWIQKNKMPAPPNPTWGWTFAYTQDGGYHPEIAPLVQYLEQYGAYNVGDHTVKLGGKDNRLLQLSKKRT